MKFANCNNAILKLHSKSLCREEKEEHKWCWRGKAATKEWSKIMQNVNHVEREKKCIQIIIAALHTL